MAAACLPAFCFRGPMDEMRQLVRILVKLMPKSLKFIMGGEENGGGNKITESQVGG
jgi:hypothetical protein